MRGQKMKINSKILTFNFIIMIIFWSLGQPGISWSNVNLQPGESSQVNFQDPSDDKADKAKNDSLSLLLCDKKSPYFTNLNPDSGQQWVAFNSVIKFTVNDDNVTEGNWDTSGIDIDKIFISIKSRFLSINSAKPDSIKLIDNKPFKVECTYRPPQPFDWSDTIEIKLDAWDLSYFRNHADTNYTFYTIRDTIAPVLTPIYPLPGDQNVPLSSTVIIQGTEIGRGVVLDSIKFWINNKLIKPDSIPGDPWDFRIYYYSDTSWYFDEDIHLVCTAFDLDRNADTLDYTFNTESPPDTIGPWFIDLIPSPGNTGVPRETSIQFTVVDDYLGVDVDSIFISITSRMQPKQEVRVDNFQIIDPRTIRCFYQPPQPFDWKDTVLVELLAYDLSKPAKAGDTTYNFCTVTDTTDRKPPIIEVIRPKPDTTNVPINSDIVLYVTDNLSGVDTNSVELKVNDQLIINDSLDFIITEAGDTVKYKPSSPFAYQAEVKVYFYVADLVENPADTSYSFWTEADSNHGDTLDLIPPKIEVIRPLPYSSNVSTDTDIVLYVTDDSSGVDTSSVTFKVNDKVINLSDANFVYDGVGDTVHYKPLSSFDYLSEVKINFYVADSAGNSADTSYSFWTADSIHDDTLDLIPPKIEVIRPLPNSTDVSIDTDIVLYVKDDSSGIDTASVVFKVNDQVIVHNNLNFIISETGDTIKYVAVSPFAYQSEVKVDFYVADRAGNSVDTLYSFWTEPEPDTTSPWFVDLDPDSADTNVDINSNIKFTVVDDKSGVDTNSVTVTLERGAYFLPGDLRILQKLDNGRKLVCEYVPKEAFNYADTVRVSLAAQDTVKNQGVREYWFAVADIDTTDRDILEPIVFDHDPAIYGSIDTLDYSIKFKVRDESGVADLSIVTKIRINDGPTKFLDSIRQVSVTGDTIKVESELLHFNYNDSIFIDIYAEDKAGNSTKTDSTTHYYFTVVQDLEAPRIVLIDPTQLTGLQDSFLVRIEDDLSGIDLEKCEMFLWSRKDTNQKKIDIPAFVKTNQVKVVEIDYYPDSPYKYNDILSLKFFLQDKVGNSATVTLLDTIYTPRLLADLFVLNLISSAGDEVVKPNTSVSLDAYVICVNEDFPDSFAVCFYFDENEVPFHTVWIRGLTKDEVQLLNTSHVISEGKHKVTVIVDCLPEGGRILEANEYNNSAEVTIVGGDPNLIVRNIFTPNDDGYNDDAEFNFEQFDCQNPNLVIFDMHGKKIKEFDIPIDKKFVWNGSDNSGRPLLPGVYLYIFSDKNKAIARGAIVIAR